MSCPFLCATQIARSESYVSSYWIQLSFRAKRGIRSQLRTADGQQRTAMCPERKFPPREILKWARTNQRHSFARLGSCAASRTWLGAMMKGGATSTATHATANSQGAYDHHSKEKKKRTQQKPSQDVFVMPLFLFGCQSSHGLRAPCQWSVAHVARLFSGKNMLAVAWKSIA